MVATATMMMRAGTVLRSEGRQREGLDGHWLELRRGDCGPAVHALQGWLQREGWRDDGPTGAYDDETVAAVRAYQEDAMIPDSGLMDLGTWASIGQDAVIAAAEASGAEEALDGPDGSEEAWAQRGWESVVSSVLAAATVVH